MNPHPTSLSAKEAQKRYKPRHSAFINLNLFSDAKLMNLRGEQANERRAALPPMHS
jgi:hypothetical protein